MGERAGGGAGAISSAAAKGSKAASTGARTGFAAMLHDPKRMQGIAQGLGMLGQDQGQEPPPEMAPMDMSGGAGAANGDPAALAAALQMARQRAMAPRQPSIFDRMGRFGGGGGY